MVSKSRCLDLAKANAFNTLRRVFDQDTRPDATTGGCFTTIYADLMETIDDPRQAAQIATLIDEGFSIGMETGLRLQRASWRH